MGLIKSTRLLEIEVTCILCFRNSLTFALLFFLSGYWFAYFCSRFHTNSLKTRFKNLLTDFLLLKLILHPPPLFKYKKSGWKKLRTSINQTSWLRRDHLKAHLQDSNICFYFLLSLDEWKVLFFVFELQV
jgi:hypothetical protein